MRPNPFACLALLALAVPAAAQHEIQKPKDNWQTPGQIQQPRGTWQTPGEIQVPKGIQAIEGHTDSKGADDYNQTLSEKRARTVKDWLVAKGAVAASTPIQGWGERKPVAPNNKPDGSDDPQGRQKNRRVEVIVDTCKEPS